MNFSRNIMLVFILLILSGGSNTFSGSVRPKIKVNSDSTPLLKLDKSQKYFSLIPSEVLAERQKKSKIIKPVLAPSYEINKKGIFSLNSMAAYLKKNNPSIDEKLSIEIAQLYINEANIEGINYDVAFSQMCLETGFLKYGGDVDPKQNNFCGLGVTGNGVKGLSFDDVQSGIRAHIQHLKAYASTDELKMDLVDERFNYVKRGCANNVYDLTGKWATDKKYGQKISNIISRINNFNN